MQIDTANEKIKQILPELEAEYGRQKRYSSKTAVEQLIATVLSQRTTYANEMHAYNALREAYPSWEEVAEAPVEHIQTLIAKSNYPEIKAPRIKELLTIILEKEGGFEMKFLEEIPVNEALKWLMELPGVGFKTATFVMLFSLKRAALPVDTHVHRVSTRTGILPAKISLEKAHVKLMEMLPHIPDELLNFHKLLFKHGQRVCTWSSPKCGSCAIATYCDYFKEKVKK
jgi:endonuclease-3